ncbi:MAG: DUF2188 domain-containing protein [Candidatus Cloacimonetes bacterium]|nr:DUF2188 domain-containing protein [Candidatus Cloacimonadota bacterium]
MPTITNKNGIPDPIFRSIKKGWYSGSNVKQFASVTGLLKPPKIFVLEKRHADNITEEASDLIWSLMGSAMHAVLEKSEWEHSINEERLFATFGDKTISGAVDLYENRTISDYKFTSVWTYIFKSRIKEWTEQLNIYGYLFRKVGFQVDKLKVITIFRDWSKSKYKYEKRYPKQIETINLKVWSDEKVESFIMNQIKLFEMALRLPDDEIPVCLPEERWQKIKWAVTKKDAQRATKLFDKKSDAEDYIRKTKRDDLIVEIRESEPIRCQDYCRCNSFCDYYQGLLNKQKVAQYL